MIGTIVICLSALACHILYCEISQKARNALRLPHPDQLAFSANNVHANHHWVWVSASCLHADRAHAVNNLLFLLGFTPQLEEFFFKRTVLSHIHIPLFSPVSIAFTYFLFTYVCCGIGGWAMTYVSHRWIKYRSEWSSGIPQFLSSVGASPNMYGFAFFACSVMPFESAGTVLAGTRYAWVMACLMLFLPFFLNDRYGLGLFTYFDCLGTLEQYKTARERKYALQKASMSSLRALFIMLLLGCLCYIVHYVVIQFGVTWGRLTFVSVYLRKNTLVMWQWVTLYALKICFMNGFKTKYRSHEEDTTDHAAHFGGAMLGMCLGYAWLDVCCTDRECINWQHTREYTGSPILFSRDDAHICYIRFYLWCLMCCLLVKVAS